MEMTVRIISYCKLVTYFSAKFPQLQILDKLNYPYTVSKFRSVKSNHVCNYMLKKHFRQNV